MKDQLADLFNRLAPFSWNDGSYSNVWNQKKGIQPELLFKGAKFSTTTKKCQNWFLAIASGDSVRRSRFLGYFLKVPNENLAIASGDPVRGSRFLGLFFESTKWKFGDSLRRPRKGKQICWGCFLRTQKKLFSLFVWQFFSGQYEGQSGHIGSVRCKIVESDTWCL